MILEVFPSLNDFMERSSRFEQKMVPWEVRGCSGAAGIHHSRVEAGEVAEAGALLPTGRCWRLVKFTSSTEPRLDLSLAFPPRCASAIVA